MEISFCIGDISYCFNLYHANGLDLNSNEVKINASKNKITYSNNEYNFIARSKESEYNLNWVDIRNEIVFSSGIYCKIKLGYPYFCEEPQKSIYKELEHRFNLELWKLFILILPYVNEINIISIENTVVFYFQNDELKFIFNPNVKNLLNQETNISSVLKIEKINSIFYECQRTRFMRRSDDFWDHIDYILLHKNGNFLTYRTSESSGGKYLILNNYVVAFDYDFDYAYKRPMNRFLQFNNLDLEPIVFFAEKEKGLVIDHRNPEIFSFKGMLFYDLRELFYEKKIFALIDRIDEKILIDFKSFTYISFGKNTIPTSKNIHLTLERIANNL